MQRWKSSVRVFAAVFAAALDGADGGCNGGRAQSYPSQPIKIIVSLAPGGVADIVARAFAAKLGEQGKQVVVENRTGGGGIIGADAAAKSAPDGYTFYMGFHATQSILPHLNSKLPYDPAKDFVPVVFITTSPNILVVHPSVPANTPKELIAYIKANPGKLSYGSPGLGSSGHLAGEQFKQLNNLEIAARALPGRGARAAGPGRGPRPGDVRHRAADQGAARGRPGAAAGDHRGQARARGAERADLCRARHAGHRGRPVVRAVRADRNAEGRDRLGQRRGEQGVFRRRT